MQYLLQCLFNLFNSHKASPVSLIHGNPLMLQLLAIIVVLQVPSTVVNDSCTWTHHIPRCKLRGPYFLKEGLVGYGACVIIIKPTKGIFFLKQLSPKRGKIRVPDMQFLWFLYFLYYCKYTLFITLLSEPKSKICVNQTTMLYPKKKLQPANAAVYKQT